MWLCPRSGAWFEWTLMSCVPSPLTSCHTSVWDVCACLLALTLSWGWHVVSVAPLWLIIDGEAPVLSLTHLPVLSLLDGWWVCGGSCVFVHACGEAVSLHMMSQNIVLFSCWSWSSAAGAGYSFTAVHKGSPHWPKVPSRFLERGLGALLLESSLFLLQHKRW